MTIHSETRLRAVTLAELIVVLVILIGLAGVALPFFSGIRGDSAGQTTEASLTVIRDALIQQWADTKYVTLDDGNGTPATEATESQRFQIRWLFDSPVSGDPISDFDPDSRTGWNGPYLASFTGRYEIDNANNFTATYGSDGDPAMIDSFTGSPIVIQALDAGTFFDVRIVSAGANGELEIDPTDPTDTLAPEGGPAAVGDDIYLSFILR